MAERRQESSRRAERRALLGFATKYRREDGTLGLRPDWKRLGLVIVVVTVGSWLLGSAALYSFMKYRRGFEEVSYTDMLLYPTRAKANRVRFGDYNIAQAREMLEAGKFREARVNLMTGVVRSPENLEGRMMLAQFHLYPIPQLYRRDYALQTLEGGLSHAVAKVDIPYIRFYLQLLLNFQEDAKVREVAARYLPAQPDRRPLSLLFAQAAAESAFFRGNFDAAEDLLKQYGLESTVAGTLLAGRIAWDRGQRALALRRVEAAMQRFPEEDILFAEASRYARELGRPDRALQYAIMRTLNNPLNPVPRVEVIYSHRALGDAASERAETLRMIEQFGDNEPAMRALANYAADTGNVDLARQIYQLALQRDFDNSLFSLLFIESHLVDKRYAEAITFAEELAREKPVWLGSSEAAFNSLRAVAYFGVRNDELANLYLARFLAAPNVRTETLLAVSRRFRGLGSAPRARQILEVAVRQDRENQAALAGLVAIDLELGNSRELAHNLRLLLRMRRPPPELLERAYRQLGGDRFLFVRDRETLLADIDGALRLPGT